LACHEVVHKRRESRGKPWTQYIAMSKERA
jgi:hypothetical protein